jgi:hypothetical protein
VVPLRVASLVALLSAAIFTPERWAFEITRLLNAVFGVDRFPIDIPMGGKGVHRPEISR